MSEGSILLGDVTVAVSIGEDRIVEHAIPGCTAEGLKRLLHYVGLGCDVASRRNRRVKRKGK